MSKCKNPICIEQVEGPQYEYCKHCWWEQDPRNDGPKMPYYTAKDKYEALTVGKLKEMLKNIPDHYEVSFDSACGNCTVGDFTIYDERVSING